MIVRPPLNWLKGQVQALFSDLSRTEATETHVEVSEGTDFGAVVDGAVLVADNARDEISPRASTTQLRPPKAGATKGPPKPHLSRPADASADQNLSLEWSPSRSCPLR